MKIKKLFEKISNNGMVYEGSEYVPVSDISMEYKRMKRSQIIGNIIGEEDVDANKWLEKHQLCYSDNITICNCNGICRNK